MSFNDSTRSTTNGYERWEGMKVTVMIEPEEGTEGEFGNTIVATKTGVVQLNSLVDVYLSATRGAGWDVDNLGAIEKTPCGEKLEYWGEY